MEQEEFDTTNSGYNLAIKELKIKAADIYITRNELSIVLLQLKRTEAAHAQFLRASRSDDAR